MERGISHFERVDSREMLRPASVVVAHMYECHGLEFAVECCEPGHQSLEYDANILRVLVRRSYTATDENINCFERQESHKQLILSPVTGMQFSSACGERGWTKA